MRRQDIERMVKDIEREHDRLERLHKSAHDLSVEAHLNQTDKGGKPYINHVCRVSNAQFNRRAAIIGLLHDTIEDTDIKHIDIVTRVNKDIADAVTVLTRLPDEHYVDYINRVLSSNDLDIIDVKIADLKDNMDVSRLKTVTNSDIKRLNKYIACYNFLVSERNQVKLNNEKGMR